MNKSTTFRLLRQRNILNAVVSYSGGNDEGEISDIECTLSTGEKIDLPTWRGKPEDQELVDLLSEPVFDRYGSFAGDFSCYGKVTWDTVAETCEMDDYCQSDYAHEQITF